MLCTTGQRRSAAYAGSLIRKTPDQVLVFRLDRHCRRLSQSARLLCFDLPAERIEQVIVELIQKNRALHFFLHPPLVYTSDLGISPRLHNIEKDFFVYGLELGGLPLARGSQLPHQLLGPARGSQPTIAGKITGALHHFLFGQNRGGAGWL
jgi:branched-chain amino acid aminotransferase